MEAPLRIDRDRAESVPEEDGDASGIRTKRGRKKEEDTKDSEDRHEKERQRHWNKWSLIFYLVLMLMMPVIDL